MSTNLDWRSKLRPAVTDRWDELMQLRREFHRYPELSFKEYQTSQRIRNWLNSHGIDDVRSVAETGVVALIRGGQSGPTLMYRADIDGLPIHEESGVEFASQNEGVMHSCGHDGHIAVALILASIINSLRQNLKGNVKVIFQPAEEIGGGASAMIEEGVMEDPKVDYALGLHVIGPLPVGVLGVTSGPMLAGTIDFNITLVGKGGHGAMPQTAVDPILVGAHVVTALQSIVSRNVDPFQPAVVTVGTFHSGTKENIIPETADITGTIRAFSAQHLQEMIQRVEALVKGVAESFGARPEVSHRMKCPPLINDPIFSAKVHRHAVDLVGEERVTELRVLADDDVACYLEKTPGTYFALGGTDPGMESQAHHQPRFSFDDRCLALGLELSLRVIDEHLTSQTAS